MKENLFKLFYALILLVFITACSQKQAVDMMVLNAKIYTVDDEFSLAECMIIHEGKIVAIGNFNELINHYAPKIKYDAGKKFIYPGFIDAHCHFIGFIKSYDEVALYGLNSWEETLDKVSEYASKTDNEWIIGRGWDQNLWKDKTFPNKQKLDSLFPDKPVFLTRVDGHAAIANQKALDLAGIKLGQKINGGTLITENGQLTGVLIDKAMDAVMEVIPMPKPEKFAELAKKAENDLFALGLTSLTDAGLRYDEIMLLDSLQKAGELNMPVYAMLLPEPKNIQYFLNNGIYKTDKLHVRSFKFYADGALGSRGALMLEEYNDQKNYKGLLLTSADTLRYYAKLLYEKGFQMNTHCIGDSANRLVLDIYGEVLKEFNDYRWRIEHAQVVNPADLEKFKSYSVLPSVQPVHATSDMYWAEERLGKERIAHAYAYQSLLKQNGMLVYGSDFPVEFPNPMFGFYAAVSRKDQNGFPKESFNKKEALSREQALRAMTIWAAIGNFEENEKGSLEVGKDATFVVFDRDLMEIPENQLHQLKVVNTFIKGKKVF
ncbi:MAG: amidohydrolase [Bacteroidia bacterium]